VCAKQHSVWSGRTQEKREEEKRRMRSGGGGGRGGREEKAVKEQRGRRKKGGEKEEEKEGEETCVYITCSDETMDDGHQNLLVVWPYKDLRDDNTEGC